MSDFSFTLRCFILLALAGLCQRHSAAQTMPAQILPPLPSAQALGQDLFLHTGSTGMVLVVVRGKETTIESFGETYPGSHQLPAANSLLRLCSLTKIFTTDLLVKLAGDGLVRLDTPLQTLAPDELHVPVRDGRAITLGDLATHTAGLPRELGPAPRGTPHFTYPGPETRWTWLPKQQLLTTPGAAALYSNVGFDLLGDALEQAAHMPYPQLLAARTTGPLGMTETTFTPTIAQCARLLIGAHPEGLCTTTSNSAGSSGLYSTATDMLRFLQYLLGTGGSLLQQSSAAQAVYLGPGSLRSVRGLDHAGDASGIGLGWVHTPGSNGSDIVEKTGGGAGFATYAALLPAQHIGLFLAATEGAAEGDVSLFRGANNVLLTLAGLPALELPVHKPAPQVVPKRKAKRKAYNRSHG